MMYLPELKALPAKSLLHSFVDKFRDNELINLQQAPEKN